MSLTRLALSSVLASSILALVVGGCTVRNKTTDEPVGSSEDQLVTDNDEAEDEDEDSEAAEQGLSGEEVATSDQGVDPGAVGDAHMDRVKTNPGRFFTPAGCIVTTVDRAARKATHVFTNCKSPAGRTFNGTVVSQWTFEPGKVTVVHDTDPGFKVNEATVERKVTITFSKAGSVYSRNRQVEMSGQTAKGKQFDRSANWTLTYDAAAKCVTRQGSATTHVGTREFSSSIDGYKRCGIGTFGCPESGTITLSRKKGAGADADIKVVVQFLGGRKVRITLPSGRTLDRNLVCRVLPA